MRRVLSFVLQVNQFHSVAQTSKFQLHIDVASKILK